MIAPPTGPADLLARRPGLLRRLAACCYDGLLLLAILFLATAIILPFNAGQAFTKHHTFYPAYLLAVSFLFWGWFWTHGGQTLGARAWKIKVVSMKSDSALSWSQAAIRFTLALLTSGIDLVLVLFNAQYLAIYERLSKTTVVLHDPA